MTHLTDDQLYHLAELSCNAELFDSKEEEQLEHVQSCRECFDKYCVLATILDATSLSCCLVFNPTQIPERASIPIKKILAVLRVTCEHMQNTISLIGKQLQQDTSAFAFEPVLANAVRGGGSGKKSILRMEDLEDEDTYFIYDAENHKMILQFEGKGNDAEKVKVYLKFEDQSTIDIPLVQKGVYLKGILADVPSGNFDVCIEEK